MKGGTVFQMKGWSRVWFLTILFQFCYFLVLKLQDPMSTNIYIHWNSKKKMVINTDSRNLYGQDMLVNLNHTMHWLHSIDFLAFKMLCIDSLMHLTLMLIGYNVTSYEPLGTEFRDIIILYVPNEAYTSFTWHTVWKRPSSRSASLHPSITSTRQDLKQSEPERERI